jgi:hypothetical protein
LEIIEALTEGVDPATGEVVAPDSSINNPAIIRALFVAKEALNAQIERQKRKAQLPENAGKPWTEAEDLQLRNLSEQGCTIVEMCTQHGRTKSAITSRLLRLGIIQE